MLVTVENSARKLIEQYAADAVFVAMDRLNRSIDQQDFHARDFWAQVVHAIHEFQRTGEWSAHVQCLRGRTKLRPAASMGVAEGS
jgi:hypothetical protein